MPKDHVHGARWLESHGWIEKDLNKWRLKYLKQKPKGGENV